MVKDTRSIEAEKLEILLSKIEQLVSKEKDVSELKKVVREQGVPNRIANRIEFAYRCLTFKNEFEKKGLFLVVSGIDKSGKETHAFNPKGLKGVKPIYKLLLERGYKVLRISLPSYQTSLGSLVASHLGKNKVKIKGKVSSKLAWILWALDRAQHAKLVSSWLSKGKEYVVVAKRWVESNVVYQMAQGVELERILNLEKNLVKQDYTIVLDVSSDVALARSFEADAYEVKRNLENVRRLYLDLPRYYPYGEFYLVDASRNPEEVNKDVLSIVENMLK
jgi:dTMP kinase